MKVTGYLLKAGEPYRGNTQSVLYKDADGVERVAYSGRMGTEWNGKRCEPTPDLTLAEYEAQRGAMQRLTESELDALQSAFMAGMITAPQPISEEQFFEWLQCLPPSRHASDGYAETFHICERLTHNLVQWCVRFKDGACYGFTDNADITKERLADKVRAAWYDKTAKAQSCAHGVAPDAWARTIADCSTITETDERA